MNTVSVAAEQTRLTHPKYRPDIDGLRAIAVLSVIGWHAVPHWPPGGFIGVDIFFVISGFLISTIVFGSLEQGKFSLVKFYSHRIKRIFPALLVVLIASYVFGWFALLADEYKQLGKYIAGGAGFVSNFVLWNESGHIDNSTKPLMHLWTLGIEEQFYIVWPLLLSFVWKRKWSFVAITASVAAISFAFHIYIINKDYTASFYFPASRFWELMIGGLLAYIGLHKPHWNERHKNAQSILGFILVVLGLALLDSKLAFTGWLALLPTLGAFFIISAGSNAWLNRHVLSNKLLVWVGLISYPLYLWHWPLLSFAKIIEGEVPSANLRIAAVLIAAALAWLTYRMIERPIRFGSRGSATTISLLILMIAVGCVGYVTYIRDGFDFRQSVKNSSLNKKVTNEFESHVQWKYMRNEICLNRYPFKEAKQYNWWFCMASKDEPPTLLLLGNIFANQLYPGFTLNDKFSRHSILSIGTCKAAMGYEYQDYPVNNPCSGNGESHQRQFIDHLIETSNSIRYVILDGLDFNFDATYISRLKERIDFLERHNIKVIIFTPHLIFNYDIRGCFSRPFKAKKNNCELSLDSRRMITEGFRPLVQQLSKTNPNVAFFDQNDLFCNNEKCSMLRNGMPLFRDEGKLLSEYGSIELSKLFAQWAGENIPELLIDQ